MRTSAIIRIVTASVVAVLLIAVLVATLMGVNIPRLLRAQRAGESAIYPYVTSTPTPLPVQTDDASNREYAAAPVSGGAASAATPMPAVQAAEGEIVFAATGIKKVKIQWVAGDVQLTAGEGNDIRFSETADRALTDTQKLRYSVQGDTLKISYCDDTFSTWNWLDLDRFNIPAKHLTVTIPAQAMESLSSLELELVSAELYAEGVSTPELDVESISGDIRISGASCGELDAQTVSGHIELVGCTARSLDLESVSGHAEAEGSFTEIDAEAVSGAITVSTDVAPHEADFHTVSGRITFNIPADTGFTAKYETVSGDLSCAMTGTMKKNSIVCGNGAAGFSFETVSGDIVIGVR